MSATSSYPLLGSLLGQALLLLVAAVAPPLLVGAAAAALVDFVQGRLGVREPTPPALARLVCGGLAAVALLPWLGGELVRFATRLLSALPLLTR